VAMCQYVLITVSGDVAVCSDYSKWRCVSMFGLQYVAIYQYVRIIVSGDVSVCSDYSKWRCVSMFGLQ
jgi:hypothetical protein